MVKPKYNKRLYTLLEFKIQRAKKHGKYGVSEVTYYGELQDSLAAADYEVTNSNLLEFIHNSSLLRFKQACKYLYDKLNPGNSSRAINKWLERTEKTLKEQSKKRKKNKRQNNEIKCNNDLPKPKKRKIHDEKSVDAYLDEFYEEYLQEQV